MGSQKKLEAETELLVRAIDEKLRARPDLLAHSLNYGRLVWRKTKNRGFEVDLELKL
jgi:hypothetical protein